MKKTVLFLVLTPCYLMGQEFLKEAKLKTLEERMATVKLEIEQISSDLKYEKQNIKEVRRNAAVMYGSVHHTSLDSLPHKHNILSYSQTLKRLQAELEELEIAYKTMSN